MVEHFNVLVVDDDEIDRIAVHRALKAANLVIHLTEVEDYQSAIAALEEHQFDCAFVDYWLPDRDGLALVRDLRQKGIRIPLVVLTGQGDEQIAVELMKAGATDYLPKSKISVGTLVNVLRKAVRIYRAERDAELAKQQQEQLARQREDFVYRLTHDLRTPLVAADRMLALLIEEAFGTISPEMQTAIATMIRSNQNLLQMVNNILEVYRHDAGHKVLSFARCDLRAILQEVVQELTPLASEKKLPLCVDYGSVDYGDLDYASVDYASVNYGETLDQGRSPIVMGDRLELHRVFTNLIGNAIKFTDAGQVSISLKQPVMSAKFPKSNGGMIAIAIQDTGSGISQNDQDHLFERFRQGENKRSGSGLGLYLSHRIIDAHHGKITVKSEPEKGSLFTVYLPMVTGA